MFRKLLFLFLAAVLAWFLGPSLTIFFSSSIPLADKVPAGFWEYFTKRDGDFYLQFVFWMIVLWFVLPVFFSLFNVLTPQARRYGTTKLLRRIHGVTTEIVILTFLFVLTAVAFGFLSKARYREAQRLTVLELNSPTSDHFGITLTKVEGLEPQMAEASANAVSTNQETLKTYLDSLKSKSVSIKPEFYDIANDTHADLAKAVEEKNVILRRMELDRRKAAQSIKNPMIGNLTSPTDYTPPILTLPPPDEYLIIRSNYLQSLRYYEQFYALLTTLRPGGKGYEQTLEAAKKTVSGLSFWRKYFLLPFPTVWPFALFVSGIVWLLAHVFWKSTISAAHHSVMRFIDEGRFGLGGSGRFAGMFEEWGVLSGYQEPGALVSMILSPIGKEHWGQHFGNWLAKERRGPAVIARQELFMGRSLYNPFLNIGLADDRHMLTIAGSRTGKGATAIIPNLLLWEGSAIVIDPKGTNAAVTANRRRQMGQKVHLIDPFGIVEKDEKLRAAFNPLEGLNPDSETIREDIGVIADALVVPDAETKEKHWDDGARTILSGLIGHLISHPGIKNPSLPMLREMLALPPDKQDELWADMSLNDRAGGAAKDAAMRFLRGAGTNEISSIVSSADKHSEWLSSPAIQKALSHSTFSFADLKEQPTTIYLILPPRYLATHNRFLRLFINMAIMQMSVGGRSKIPVLMVLDEFLALGHMAEVEKALGLMAGYNLVLWPFVQDLGRLKDLYKKSINSFIANSRAVQVFGVSDVETTEYISKQLGNSSVATLPTKLNTLVPLRSPDEVAKDIVADSDRQYILRAGKPPLVLEKVAYHRGGLLNGAYPGLFHGKYDPDPDHTS